MVALLPRVAGNVDTVILRWKLGPVRDQVGAARRLAAVAPRPTLLISDRIDVARAAGLDGVQLTEAGALPGDVRRVWSEALIGVSRHDLPGVEARSEGADFVLVAPVFPTGSKPGARPLGLDKLRTLARATPVELIGLGGIDAENAGQVITAGASGIAVRAAVFAHADPEVRVRALREALDSAAAAFPDDEFVTGPDGGVRPE
jgi:thiamine-phosphate diphosphorylase